MTVPVSSASFPHTSVLSCWNPQFTRETAVSAHGKLDFFGDEVLPRSDGEIPDDACARRRAVSLPHPQNHRLAKEVSMLGYLKVAKCIKSRR